MRPGKTTNRDWRRRLRYAASIWICGLFAAIVASPAQAQSQQSVDVRIAIFGDLSIVKVADLDFGNIVETGGGTVVMTADASATCTSSANIVQTGVCQPAEFGGSGETGRIVRIKKPSSNRITLTGPGADMDIDDLVIDGSPELTLIQATSGYSRYRIDSASGIFAFRLAGTLNVGVAQTPGTYTGTFQVDIQYN